jgi:16S rRNA processing protein RimM
MPRPPPPGPASPGAGPGLPPVTLALGQLGRTHGVRGEIIFRPFNPDGVSLVELDLPVEVELRPRDAPPESPARALVLEAARPFKDGALVRFEGVASPEEASRLTNQQLYVLRTALPPLSDGEFYISDLLGCAVTDVTGRDRGQVAGCYWNGTQDILQIRGPEGEETLIPAVEDFLREVDLAGRRIVIDDHE